MADTSSDALIGMVESRVKMQTYSEVMAACRDHMNRGKSLSDFAGWLIDNSDKPYALPVRTANPGSVAVDTPESERAA